MSRSVDEDSYPEAYMDPGPGEDEHLEADYEDRNGDPHGVGSPEYEEGDEGGWDDDLEYEDEDLEPYDGSNGYPEEK